jgi:hypothetical protein
LYEARLRVASPLDPNDNPSDDTITSLSEAPKLLRTSSMSLKIMFASYEERIVCSSAVKEDVPFSA